MYDSERIVLGGALLNPKVMERLEGRIQPEDFGDSRNERIWEAMLRLAERGRAINEITIRSEIPDGDLAYLMSMGDHLPVSASIEEHASRVRDKATRRRLKAAGERLVRAAESASVSPVDIVEHCQDELRQAVDGARDFQTISIRESMSRTMDVIEKAVKAEGRLTGIPTGFDQLDDKLCGLQPQDLIILAGRPSMGKTALALNMGRAAADTGSVAIFSLEMSSTQLTMRLVSSESGVSSEHMRSGTVTDDEWPRLSAGVQKISELPLRIDEGRADTVGKIRAECRRIKAHGKLSLVVVDYIQLMRGRSTGSREQEISGISRGLKLMAKELDVPVLALSQLNRSLESRPDKRPMLSDLRESGSLEQDADVILFVYRDEYYNDNPQNKGMAEIIIGKQRNGPTGRLEMLFKKHLTRFEAL